jgi:hypothetical protein
MSRRRPDDDERGCDDPNCASSHMSKRELRKWHADHLRKHGFYAHFVAEEFADLPHPLSHFVNFHTHGFEETWGHPDFQIVMPIRPETALDLFWIFANRVKAGEKFEVGKRYKEIAAAPYDTLLVKAREAGRDVLRVLLPDAKNRMPGDKGVDPGFDLQTKAP